MNITYKKEDVQWVPISRTVADIFLQKLEKDIVLNHPIIHFWKRYVDDVFAVVDKDSIDEILSLINNYIDKIEFTIETQKDGILPFLDILIIRQPDNTIKTRVYRKCDF